MAAVVGISKSAVSSADRQYPKLNLIIQLEPAHRVFLSNLGEVFRHTPPHPSWSCAQFWPDVFVASRLPWSGFLESALWHAVGLAALWVFSHVWLMKPELIAKNAFDRSEVFYYSPSEYLPPIDTGRAPAREGQKGEPEFAKQPIISVPSEADNRTQTIVTVPDLKLKQEIAVPNIVAWNQATPAAPIAATGPQRNLPNLEVLPVPPAPDVNQAGSRRITAPEADVVAPAPEVSGMATRQVASPRVAVVAPPPVIQGELRKFGEINIGHGVVAPAPQLPMPEQRTSAAAVLGIGAGSPVPPPPSLQSAGRPRSRQIGALAGENGQAVPPPPSIQGTGSSGGGRLIALGIHPSATPPPEGLQGNRRGRFAASPEGKAGAPGTPDVSAGSTAAGTAGGGGGKGNGGGGTAGGDSAAGIPAGIHVGAAPGTLASSPIGGSLKSSPSISHGSFGPLVADNRPMRVTVTPHGPTSSGRPPTEIERSIFHDRKSYSMILNMPNLNSVGGSWIIRFAEKVQSDAGADLTAPEATRKVDPGYPAELMRQNVHGTVILYAVIRSDGTVAGVRVLSSVDERLDHFARVALSHWQFRPAIKNGNAVDLEAVVTIPFRARNSF